MTRFGHLLEQSLVTLKILGNLKLTLIGTLGQGSGDRPELAAPGAAPMEHDRGVDR